MSANMHTRVNTSNRPSKTSGWQSEYECDTDSQYSTESCHEEDPILSPDIGQRVRTLFQKRLYTDVKFVVSCGIKPKPSLLAHKAILAIGSPVFANMFDGQDEVMQHVIQINNTPFTAFSSIVEYLYTDAVYFESESQVMEIHAAAKVFQVPALVDRCVSYIESSEITEANVCTKLQMATKHKLEDCKQRCAQFIQENTGAVIRSLDFKSSPQSIVQYICKMPQLFLSSEKELFEGILGWMEGHRANHNESRRDLLQPFLQHIRFLSITSTEFSQIVTQHSDIFTVKEAMNIIMYLSNPTANNPNFNLPVWFNKGPNRCTNLKGVQRNPEYRNRNFLDRKVIISLKPIRRAFLPNLMCMLEMKCYGGNYRIKALKLSFGEPVTQESTIEHLVITVSSEPNPFSFKERVKVHNSAEVIVPFTRSLLARRGNRIHICAEANEVKNYTFLQFDEERSFLDQSPFECKLGSLPKEKRLFFISEVIFEEVPLHPTGKSLHNRRRRR